MNTPRPTPETDAFAIKFKTPCGEKYWVPVDIARKLERERDELRRWTSVNGVIELQRQRDEARAEMIRWMSIAEGRGRTEDDDTGKAMAKLIRQRDEAREQRDRLAAVLQSIRDCYGGHVTAPDCCEDCEFLIPIDAALQSLNQPEP